VGVEIEKGRYITHKPGLLYHCMIDGMVPFSMRGVIWYQGEDDGRNKNYASDLTALIESYRNLWKKDDLAFHMVQIAQTTYASGMLGVYQAQVAVTEKLAQCGLAPSNTLQAAPCTTSVGKW
jgi:sialate O-acetylesterase